MAACHNVPTRRKPEKGAQSSAGAVRSRAGVPWRCAELAGAGGRGGRCKTASVGSLHWSIGLRSSHRFINLLHRAAGRRQGDGVRPERSVGSRAGAGTANPPPGVIGDAFGTSDARSNAACRPTASAPCEAICPTDLARRRCRDPAIAPDRAEQRAAPARLPTAAGGRAVRSHLRRPAGSGGGASLHDACPGRGRGGLAGPGAGGATVGCSGSEVRCQQGRLWWQPADAHQGARAMWGGGLAARVDAGTHGVGACTRRLQQARGSCPEQQCADAQRRGGAALLLPWIGERASTLPRAGCPLLSVAGRGGRAQVLL